MQVIENVISNNIKYQNMNKIFSLKCDKKRKSDEKKNTNLIV